jgi:hypothetical protein
MVGDVYYMVHAIAALMKMALMVFQALLLLLLLLPFLLNMGTSL